MQNSLRRFIRAGAVCFIADDLLTDSLALLGGGFAFDKGHHHARHLNAVVTMLQAVNARVVQVFTQTLAAAVQQEGAVIFHKFGVTLDAKHLLANGVSRHRAVRVAGQ